VIARHKAGKFKVVGDGKNQVDLTHVDNVVHAHLCALQAMVSEPSLGGKAYFIGQEEPVCLWEWLNLIFAKIGLPALEKNMAFKTAYQLGSLIEKVWSTLRLKSDPPMTRFVACQLAQDHWFSSRAARNDLNYRPILSMDQAMEKTLPWLQSL
jgi:nucleoside-diphosphate-sugar epimerase